MQGVFIPGSRDDAWLAKLQTIYRVESAVLLSVIGVGLALCEIMHRRAFGLVDTSRDYGVLRSLIGLSGLLDN